MDLIAIAERKRDWHLSEAERYEAFVITARELEGGTTATRSQPAVPPFNNVLEVLQRTPASRPMTGIGADTLNAAEKVIRERGPMSTRELLPYIVASGIDVGGKDPVATLSARISNKGDLVTYNSKWHFKKDLASQGLAGLAENETADTPGKDASAASLFTQAKEETDAAPIA